MTLGTPAVLVYAETGTPHELHQFEVKTCLFAGRTAFQDVAILDTHGYGKMLVIDGRTQSAEDDEYIYHEILVHPAMLVHPNPRRVLIVGGGEGATLREVLRYRSVERVVMVDIDQELVELCQKLLPEWHQGAFEDSRVELRFADGKEYIEHTTEQFDVIIVDVCDALEAGPALALYTESFYGHVRARLAPDGLLVVQAMELSGLDFNDHREVRNTLQRVFALVRSYSAFIPSFWAEWGFIIASDGVDPILLAQDTLAERLRTRGGTGVESLGARLRYYGPGAHLRLFSLPKDVEAALAHQTPTDASE
jgi:spermidine synthase